MKVECFFKRIFWVINWLCEVFGRGVVKVISGENLVFFDEGVIYGVVKKIIYWEYLLLMLWRGKWNRSNIYIIYFYIRRL